MPITPAQIAQADAHQRAAATDPAPQVSLVAGPGTGKSHTIAKRIAHLLLTGATPGNVYVISFTRPTRAELKDRILSVCTTHNCGTAAQQVWVSTMHSLALHLLWRANLLSSYPSTPTILDDWEQRNVYDEELATSMGCNPSRAAEVRRAYDAQWQTLNPAQLGQAGITRAEIAAFNAFRSARTKLYSCILPGELISRCVQALQQGVLRSHSLPPIDHLIVDEYQDLNACDQEFVRLLCAHSCVLFVAGDDDQSIYLQLRHADPTGIVRFSNVYPSSARHVLTDCFRCTPAILQPATQMIAYNTPRVAKNVRSLYAGASPPVQGRMLVWSFRSAHAEARAIAQSCQELLNAGMAGREDEILILISNRRVQLNMLVQELQNLGLPYDIPPAKSLADQSEPARAVYSLLRLARDNSTNRADYPAHRDILGLLSGVGVATAKAVGDLCISNHQDFRHLFYLRQPPAWLSRRPAKAVARVIAILRAVSSWAMPDTLSARSGDILNIISSHVYTTGRNAATKVAKWNHLASTLPARMTLEELLQYLSADTDSERQAILPLANQRDAGAQASLQGPPTKHIRILTMHGAKGLSGKIVFIPGAEQGLMPTRDALQATELLIEQRRLFYVSVTRAMACCVVSHAFSHSGAPARVLTQAPVARLRPSQFLNELGVPSVSRTGGLTPAQASAIVNDVMNL
ncbi:MAG TPA: ATP-dependent helicase [Anaerolineae bacterium]|nr:ATP-dependent helicase [Anaerolineae bacterium]